MQSIIVPASTTTHENPPAVGHRPTISAAPSPSIFGMIQGGLKEIEGGGKPPVQKGASYPSQSVGGLFFKTANEYLRTRKYEGGLFTLEDMMQYVVELSLKGALNDVCGGTSLYDAGGLIHVSVTQGPAGEFLPPDIRLGDDFTVKGLRPTDAERGKIESIIAGSLIQLGSENWEKVEFGPGNVDNATYTVKSGNVTRSLVNFSN